jgi:hypothetical protein
MQTNDIINGSLELTSALFCTINIFKLVKDKEIKGVSWLPTFFYMIWGIWNLYYYPSLGQVFSFVGGVFIFAVNIVWLLLLFYYNNKKNV